MKQYRMILTVALFGVCSSNFAMVDPYERPEDYAVVNAILRKSNLTQSDVDKLKLVGAGRLKGLPEAAAGTAGAYAAYKVGEQAYELGGKAAEFRKDHTFLESYLSEGILDVLTDKRLWAFAGVAGLGYGAYKILYTRLQTGILNQVENFVEMCENLDVYNYNYAGQYESYLSQMGTASKKSDGSDYMSKWIGVNAAWAASNIARKKGVDNLLSQANMATKLLSQMENTVLVQELRDKLSNIVRILTNNKSVIDKNAKDELDQRKQGIDIQMQGAQRAAQLDLTKETTSALWYNKILNLAKAVVDLPRKTLETFGYIGENEANIVKGTLIAGTALYAAYSWLEGKYMERQNLWGWVKSLSLPKK